MTTLPVDRLERMPIMQKYHIAYGIRNNVLGMSIVMDEISPTEVEGCF